MWCDRSHRLREHDPGRPVPIWNSIRPADTQTGSDRVVASGGSASIDPGARRIANPRLSPSDRYSLHRSTTPVTFVDRDASREEKHDDLGGQ